MRTASRRDRARIHHVLNGFCRIDRATRKVLFGRRHFAVKNNRAAGRRTPV
jgi:hypothetical protein